MTKRVAVYARVSTPRQAENDISIPDQLAQGRRFCDGRGWIVAREFVDAGATARDDKRPELQHMMEIACTDPSPFDVVLVHSQSRFFRDTAGYVFYKRRLEKHAVSLVSMTQDFGAGPAADFAETIIAAADTLHSAENAKHVSRTMLENARQGFWNGSNAPFGYRTVEAEKRGQKVKKRLEIDEREAATVRQIFKLFLEGDGESGSLGVKGIASWLNRNGFRNKSGNPFYTGSVHLILKGETYAGVHYWNRTDSRSRKVKPKDEWISVQVPAIITQAEFNQVQDLLMSGRPSVTAPRITTSDVLLTGLAYCENCGGALMLGTGKSGRYRYYSCSSSRLKGKAACPMPTSIPEAELDVLVLEALTDHLMTPERLKLLLRESLRHRREMAAQTAGKRQAIKAGLKNSEAQIERLLTAVATGALPDMSLLRAKIDELNAQRDECNRHLALLDQPLPELRQVLSNQQARSVAASLKRRLLEAPKATQRRYVRGLVSNIVVNRELAVITGPQAALASYASNPDRIPAVPGLVREWRTRQDESRHWQSTCNVGVDAMADDQTRLSCRNVPNAGWSPARPPSWRAAPLGSFRSRHRDGAFLVVLQPNTGPIAIEKFNTGAFQHCLHGMNIRCASGDGTRSRPLHILDCVDVQIRQLCQRPLIHSDERPCGFQLVSGRQQIPYSKMRKLG